MQNFEYTVFTTGATQQINNMSIISKLVFILILILLMLFIFLRIKLEKDKAFVNTYFGTDAAQSIKPKKNKHNKNIAKTETVQNKDNCFPDIDTNRQLLRRLENGVYCYYQQADDGSYFRVKTPENQ